jgi:hypothetical protein
MDFGSIVVRSHQPLGTWQSDALWHKPVKDCVLDIRRRRSERPVVGRCKLR